MTLAEFKGSTEAFVAPLAAVSALVFVWANGVYWWIIAGYPYIEIGPDQFVNRDELRCTDSRLFLLGYAAIAIGASLACINVAFG
jgi:hypothetical protein